MSADTTELYKRYDNSNEKPNPLNYKSTVEGVIIPFAAVGTVGTAFVFVLFDYGLGKHFWAIGEAKQVQFQKVGLFAIAILAIPIHFNMP
ncbi:hypothetical protein O1611_g9597 [Lasiodiplodia mahajangana]|uniref:Uncharacterized protein n=1 Tax=Lasiodiplodia mahajangana TaxID=1108764 RepID=A0ACC2J7L7_9PEZI|nr:hypothetical protein O1611_g9597 [Lasiodiplodia mahajangana]